MLGAAALALVAACADAPTVPDGLHWLVDGEEWRALLPPDSLPNPSGWVVAGSDSSGIGGQIRTMEREADQALSRGDLARSARVRRAAVTLLAGDFPSHPSPVMIRDAASSIDLWVSRVQSTVAGADAPHLAAAFEVMLRRRREAGYALAAGDSVAAAIQLMSAAEQVREWSPMIVALRLLDRAEDRLDLTRTPQENARRARHLIRSGREAVRAGDAVRAIQRALYALQLAGGQEVVGYGPRGG